MRLLLRFKQVSWEIKKKLITGFSLQTGFEKVDLEDVLLIGVSSNEFLDQMENNFWVNKIASYLRNIFFNDLDDGLHACLSVQNDFDILGHQVCQK